MRVFGSYCPLKAVWIGGVLSEGLVHLHGKREGINGPFPKGPDTCRPRLELQVNVMVEPSLRSELE